MAPSTVFTTLVIDHVTDYRDNSTNGRNNTANLATNFSDDDQVL
jgi:hypothetical protein